MTDQNCLPPHRLKPDPSPVRAPRYLTGHLRLLSSPSPPGRTSEVPILEITANWRQPGMRCCLPDSSLAISLTFFHFISLLYSPTSRCTNHSKYHFHLIPITSHRGLGCFLRGSHSPVLHHQVPQKTVNRTQILSMRSHVFTVPHGITYISPRRSTLSNVARMRFGKSTKTFMSQASRLCLPVRWPQILVQGLKLLFAMLLRNSGQLGKSSFSLYFGDMHNPYVLQ